MSRSILRAARLGLVPVAVAAFLTSCSEGETVAPAIEASPAEALNAQVATGRRIVIMDNCDPATFPPGFCPGRDAGMPVDRFFEQLARHQRVDSWRFSPDVIQVTRHVEMAVVNLGGREHTFTEVSAFGPGLVPPLNELMGFGAGATPVPECLDPEVNFIDPGEHETVTFHPGPEKKYMCCLHPWMRAVTR